MRAKLNAMVTGMNALLPSLLAPSGRSLRKGTPRYSTVEVGIAADTGAQFLRVSVSTIACLCIRGISETVASRWFKTARKESIIYAYDFLSDTLGTA